MANQNPYIEILANPESADDAVAELLRNEKQSPDIAKAQKQLPIILFKNLFVSGLIAVVLYLLFDLSDVAVSIVFVGCMINSLHRGLLAIVTELNNQTIAQANLSNAARACVLTLHKQKPTDVG